MGRGSRSPAMMRFEQARRNRESAMAAARRFRVVTAVPLVLIRNGHAVMHAAFEDGKCHSSESSHSGQEAPDAARILAIGISVRP